MKSILLMFFLFIFSSHVIAAGNSVTKPLVTESRLSTESTLDIKSTLVTEPSLKQISTKNKPPIDQSHAEKLKNAKEPTTSATDKNIQKAPKTKPININDAVPKDEADLIDGLILNRAMTRLGHRFYREFVAAYRDIGGESKHTGLTVIEQATARSGSKILIQQNRKTVFVTFVSPISRNIDDQANYAAKRVNSAVVKQNEQAVLGALFDPDLAPDEF
ncbi:MULTISPECIES: curli production assembly/transport protein CsgE [unclassified Shewanella]|uniref:curli production assembly/transport protein CsgE n=1 Tax=unclassified Shewanella TaxID=196818 RepID=UPI001F535DE0|nr:MULTISPECIES: curli production assembly/transport protein CsgE [unclassified Shewanella]MDO6618188.1 curli production assembly/transport protein CsgE [Shewanella sp. 6_MG-2023]MDO6638460.1 curli production assembly/transport protein CsgE [Shewanella sp. 5_MG-2023]MDO6774283.1 curli production assembly/transport protein CsgE [Shewanella sp. 3_MG-2023]